MSLDYQFICCDKALDEFCQNALKAEFVALDTEFIRIRSYYPKLGLIQIYYGETVALVDPMMITNWQPFIQLLTAPTVIKLLHACSEDLDVFIHEFSVLPRPLYDTQVIAAFMGHPISSGFSSLVKEYLDVEVDKSESRTDWLARPLTEKQCLYAASDVYYLLPMAKKLLALAKNSPWLPAIEQEIAALLKRRQKEANPESAYLSIANSWQLTEKHLFCLQNLARWRLDYARQHDIALNFVVHEESLWKVAHSLPSNLAQLQSLGLKPTEIRLHGKTLLNYTEAAEESSAEQWPDKIIRVIDTPNYKQNNKNIRTILHEITEQTGLRAELLASRRQIDQLIKWYWNKEGDTPELLEGWRGELFAHSLNQLNIN